jgi:hypothetical protein
VGDLGAVLGIDDNTAAVVELHTDVLKTKAASVGTTANGAENDFSLELWNELAIPVSLQYVW